MNCAYCQAPLPAASRRDRRYCNSNCRARASYWRGRNGDPAPQPWRHEALASEDPALAAAAEHAQQLAEARGWSRTTLRGVLDGLATVLRDLPSGARVPMSEVRSRPHQDVSRPRLAEVLGDLGLLHDDSTAAVRALIERIAGELAPGFAGRPPVAAGAARRRPPREAAVGGHDLRLLRSGPPGPPGVGAHLRPPPGSHPLRHLHGARVDVRLPAQENSRRTAVAVPLREAERAGIHQPGRGDQDPADRPFDEADDGRRDPRCRGSCQPPGATAGRRPGRRARRAIRRDPAAET